MEIKYSDGVYPAGSSAESPSPKINTPQKNYSGASVDGSFYGRMGTPLSGRALNRRRGQRGPGSPLLKGLKNKTSSAGPIMRRPFSVHSSKPRVRDFARMLEKVTDNGATQEES